jgi:16S rRNA (adenine1518-N6/adenine1519-N6)-dimethyltransferase
VRPNKALGQNFVLDPNTIRKVLASAEVQSDDSVLEIGAGAGSLTLGLAERAGFVTAVEFDRGLIPVLAEILADRTNVEVIHADALDLDLSRIDGTKLVANLPYNIAVPVVMRVLEEAPLIRDLTVMTQREIGERLVASPGNKTYGAPTVLVAYFASARIAGTVSRRAFWPEPGVDSVILKLVRKETLPDVPFANLARVVKIAFSQRRKTLRNSLAQMAGSPSAAGNILSGAGIEVSTRAEEISLADYLRIASSFAGP